MPMSELTGRHIVITGATGALGGGVVAALLERGATCHVPMTESALPAHLPWRAHERVVPRGGISLDDETAVTNFFAGIPSLWASIHLVGGFAMAPLLETSLADFTKQHSLNTVTCFLCCREAARAMNHGGRIVNVAARPALSPSGGMVAYTTAKAAVASMTQTLAIELRDRGILVNAVAPSIIDSPANRASMPTADFASWPTPAQIAETIAFLISPNNTLTSGAIIPVYGRA